jgi:methionine-rich copper-binding protein CopC
VHRTSIVGRITASLLVAVSVTALVAWQLATPAVAHTGLQSASPAPGARVDRPPAQVQLHFVKQTVPDPRTKVKVVGPSGTNIAVGSPSVTGLGISQRVSPAHQVGVYVVSYTVVSVDHHVTRSGYDFLLTKAAPVTSTNSFPVWQWALLLSGFVVVVVVGSVVLRSRQRDSGA